MGTLVVAVFFATRISLPIVLKAEGRALNCEGSVRAESVTDPTNVTAVPIVKPNATLDFDVAGRWKVGIETDNCWASPITVSVPEDARADLRVWPKGELRGAVSVPAGYHLPDTLRLELKEAGTTGSALLGVVSCVVSGNVKGSGDWRCAIPKTNLDIRVSADTFAPIYVRDLSVETDVVSLPLLELKPGASLSGWVWDSKGRPAPLATVQLKERGAATAAIAHGLRDVFADEKGFFQFQSIPSGDYLVTADRKGSVRSTPADVAIREAREYLLRDPLTLRSPASLQVQVLPSTSPEGELWNAKLFSILPQEGTLELRKSGTIDPMGLWHVEGLQYGPYSIEIIDRKGSVVARVDKEIVSEEERVDLEVSDVRVEGHVRFGTEPVQAKLRFSSSESDVEMLSASDGTFEGWLPHKGTWDVLITPDGELLRIRKRISVHLSPNATRAQIDLDLPAGKIRGVVVDEQGRGVPRCDIRIMRGSEFAATAGTNTDGSFTVRGIDLGSATIFAKKRELFSDPHLCTVTKDSLSIETVVLRYPVERKGRLAYRSGQPVVGAIIRYLVDDRLLATTSGPQGEFALTLSSNSEYVDLVVFTTRRTVAFDRIHFGGDEILVIIPEDVSEVRILPLRNMTPQISKPGMRPLPITLLFGPQEGLGRPAEALGGALTFRLAPGAYRVCFSMQADCVSVIARAGETEEVVDPVAFNKEK